jgi:hypothetical protein
MSSVEPVSHKMHNVGYGPLLSNYAIDNKKYMLEGNNKTMNAHINMMRSNRTSILRKDPDLIPLLGSVQITKKLCAMQTAQGPIY